MRADLERLLERRSISEKLREELISRSVDRAAPSGIYLKKGFMQFPVVSTICVPKYPSAPIFQQEHLVEKSIESWPRIAHLSRNVGLDIIQGLCGRGSLSDSLLYYYSKEVKFVIEFSTYGAVSLISGPFEIINQRPYVRLGYLADSVIWPILFAAKVTPYPCKYEVRIILKQFDDCGIIGIQRQNKPDLHGIEKMEPLSILRDEFITQWDPDMLIQVIERVARKVAWALNLSGSEESFADEFKELLRTIDGFN